MQRQLQLQLQLQLSLRGNANATATVAARDGNCNSKNHDLLEARNRLCKTQQQIGSTRHNNKTHITFPETGDKHVHIPGNIRPF